MFWLRWEAFLVPLDESWNGGLGLHGGPGNLIHTLIWNLKGKTVYHVSVITQKVSPFNMSPFALLPFQISMFLCP